MRRISAILLSTVWCIRDTHPALGLAASGWRWTCLTTKLPPAPICSVMRAVASCFLFTVSSPYNCRTRKMGVRERERDTERYREIQRKRTQHGPPSRSQLPCVSLQLICIAILLCTPGFICSAYTFVLESGHCLSFARMSPFCCNQTCAPFQ